MYLEHFRLRELPFTISPGPAFAYATRAHQEALNTLLVAVQGGEGFVKITGEVGTGKTMLCRRFMEVLQGQDGYATAYIPNPLLQPVPLLLALARELQVPLPEQTSQYDLMWRLNAHLLQEAQAGRSVVVCLDEAQALPLETLEALRLLSNLETEQRKLVQLVLFGQPEFDEILARQDMRQLRQRISFQYSLAGMSEREMDRYLAHRLVVAGYVGADLFSSAAVHLLHRATRGVPRLINVLAHKALLVCFGEGRHEILPHHVRAAARDTEAAMALGPFAGLLRWPRALLGLGGGRL